MEYLEVKNWDSFQQYKDRDPKWIKLHRDVLDNYEFDSLTEVQQCHLIKIWLLAAKLGNEIPNDAKWIAKKIGAQSKVDVDQLVTSGFLIPYKSVQNGTKVYLEEEREERREREEEETPLSGKPDGDTPNWTAQAREVFSYWQQVMEHPQAKFNPDDDRIKKVIQQLKSGYSVDDLKQAVDGCAKTPHNMGDNERGQRYDGLNVICKNGDNVDRFIRAAAGPGTGGMSSAGRKTAAAAREFLND